MIPNLAPTFAYNPVSMSWRFGLFGLALICVLLSNSSAQNSQGKPIDNSAIWEPPSVIDFPQGVKSSVPEK